MGKTMKYKGGDGGGVGGAEADPLADAKCTMLTLYSDKKGMIAAFEPLYKMTFVITCILYIGLVAMAWYDVARYWYTELTQKYNMENANVFIDQTNDFSVIQYTTTDPETEPYNIYASQKMLGYILSGIAAFMCIVGVNLFLYFGLFFYKNVKNDPFTEHLGFGSDFLLIAITFALLAGGCQILYDKYNATFVKGVMVNILDTRKKFSDIREFSVKHLPLSDTVFLRNLKMNNQNAIATEVVNYIKAQQMGDQSAIAHIQNIVFACDLYNYFKENVPVSDPMYNNIDDLFSPDGFKHDVDINRYFYYAHGVQIRQEAWDDLKSRVIAKLPDMDDATWNGIEQKVTVNSLTQQFNDKVEKDIQAGNLQEDKKKLYNYMWSFATVATAILVVACIINYRCLTPLHILWRKFVDLLRQTKIGQRILGPES